MNVAKLLCFFIAAALVFGFTARPEPFVFSREAIAAGELWRLWTCHFVHFSTEHLLGNLAAFGALLLFAPRTSRWQFIWLVVVSPILLAALLYSCRPGLQMYGGLSGSVSAIFMFVATQRSQGRGGLPVLFRISILIFVAKVLFEFAFGGMFLARFGRGVLVEPAAHAFGAALGFVAAILSRTGTEAALRSSLLRDALSVENKKAVPEGTA